MLLWLWFVGWHGVVQITRGEYRLSAGRCNIFCMHRDWALCVLIGSASSSGQVRNSTVWFGSVRMVRLVFVFLFCRIVWIPGGDGAKPCCAVPPGEGHIGSRRCGARRLHSWYLCCRSCFVLFAFCKNLPFDPFFTCRCHGNISFSGRK